MQNLAKANTAPSKVT